jgi:hypothetical protein
MTVGRENQEMISKIRTTFMGTYLFVFGPELTNKKGEYLSHASSVLNRLAAAAKGTQS